MDFPEEKDVLPERLCRFKLNKKPKDVDRALRYIVRSAYENIPVYRRLLDEAKVSWDSIRGAEDLSRLPVVNRTLHLVESPVAERLHSRTDLTKCVRKQTSGSEGIPVTVFMSRSEALYRRFQVLRAWEKAARLRFPLTIIDVDARLSRDTELQVQRLGAFRLVRVSPGPLATKDIERLIRFQKAIISGCPSILVSLSETLGSLSSRLSPAMAVTRGEVLHDSVRSELEKAFGCDVVDFYSCEEIGYMAWPCPSDKQILHVNTDACIVEIVDNAGTPLPTGVEGRVLVTNLFNYTMPFIRYDLQDRSVLLSGIDDRCVCGGKTPRLGVVQGRDDDFLNLTDGSRISPRIIATVVENAIEDLCDDKNPSPLFRRYQVLQDAPDHVTVRVVPIADSFPPLEPAIRKAIERLDPGLLCSVVLVDGLPSAASGKFRKVVRTFDSNNRQPH